MKKKLSMAIAIILVSTSFIGCQKTTDEVAPATQQVETPEVDVIDEVDEIEELDESDSLEDGELDEDAEESEEGDEGEEGDETGDGEESEESDEDLDDTTVEENEITEGDETDEEEEVALPLADEELSEDGTTWNQPEDLVNYKMTVNNLSEEEVTFSIYYGVETDFEHEVTVSAMASKTIRVENALPGEHTVKFASEAEELLGDVQIWISDEAF